MKRNMWIKKAVIGIAFGMLISSMPISAYADEMITEDESCIIAEDETEAKLNLEIDEVFEDNFDDSIIIEEDEPEIDKSILGIAADETEDDDQLNACDESADLFGDNTALTFSGDEMTITTKQNNKTNEELFSGYVEDVFYHDDLLFAQGDVLNARDSLEGQNAQLYDFLFDYVLKIASGERESTIVTVGSDVFDLSDQRWYAEDLDVESVINDNRINPVAAQTVLAHVNCDYQTVIDALCLDLPYELYWYDKAANIIPFQINCEYDNEREEYYLVLGAGMQICFSVAIDYAGDVPYSINAELISSVFTAKENADQIILKHAYEPDQTKLVSYKNEICNLVSYNDQAANVNSINPWQMIWVFDGNADTNVVCEGYSKAFQYLCDKTEFENSISVYSVTGVMSGGTGSGLHMWNIIEMENGAHYLADITNCDFGSVGYSDLLFLKGYSSGNVQDGYVFNCYDNEVKYTYDDTTKALYSEDKLRLSQTDYEYHVPGDTYQYIYDDIVYKISSAGYGVVTGYKGTPIDVEILDYVNGIPITEIGGKAFRDCTSLRSIKIPNTITRIRDGNTEFVQNDDGSYSDLYFGAFGRCTNLQTVTIPSDSNLSYIGIAAFCRCTNLISIQLPNSIRELAMDSFCRCSALETLNLPEGLQYVRQDALTQTGIKKLDIPSTCESFNSWNSLPKLEWVDVAPNNPTFFSEDGMLIRRNGGYLTVFPAARTGDWVFPKSVKTISTIAAGLLFGSCETMYLHKDLFVDELARLHYDDIVIEDGSQYYKMVDGVVYDPEETVLYGAPKKEEGEFIIKDGIVTIATSAFSNCYYSKVQIPDSVQKIGFLAFFDCPNLDELWIPETTTFYWNSGAGDHVFSKKMILHGSKGSEAESYASKFGHFFVDENEIGKDDLNVYGAVDDVFSWRVDLLSGNLYIDGTGVLQYSILEDMASSMSNAIKYKIKAVVIGEGITKLDASLHRFELLPKINTVSLPSTLLYLGTSPLEKLTTIELAPDNPNYCLLDGVLYDKSMETIVWYPACKEGIIFTLPDQVIKVQQGAFSRNQNIEELVVNSIKFSLNYAPAKLKRIVVHSKSFNLNATALSELKEIVLCPGIEEVSFYLQNCEALTPLIVPDSIKKCQIILSKCPAINIYFMGDAPIQGVVTSPIGSEKPVAHYPEGKTGWEAFIGVSHGALFQNMSVIEYQQETCEDDGLKIYKCEHCQREFQEVVPASHNVVIDNAVAPTCTEDGLSEGRHCSRCNAVIIEQVVLPATGHLWEEQMKVDQVPTCIAEGKQSIHCSKCDEIKEGSEEILPVNPSNHCYKEWIIVEEPSCNEEGVKRKTCIDCGAVEEEAILAKGHSWNKGIVTKAATITASGVKTYTCSSCGETKTESIPKITEKITITKKPTIKKPAAAKGKITVKWKHFKNKTKKGKKIWKPIKKVQVQCATDKGFSNIVKSTMVGKKKTKAVIKGLAKKTTYYVRVRYYDGTGYSAWSGVKKVKTK